ncbi:hypothetical protein JTB14_038371 [Gonioctena quinquepunctata]|nr:hypothetical protein JTB14_038371 [Gonioctena quinquepunctata]
MSKPLKGSSRISTTGGSRVSTTRTSKSIAPKSSVKGEKKKEKIPLDTLPAFSILPKKKEGINWEALKEQTKRRQAPEGEDIKEIRKILKELINKKIPVHDFISLVSPYTADNGNVLRTIMAEDVATFQKIARRVYETMTQDVSDVLVNEQLNMVQYYQEKHDLMTEKMMRAINGIFEMAPDFDFEKYQKGKDEYLQSLLPLPMEVNRTAEDIDMQKRQEAYHRLQWLRSEGERMTEENKRLQRRLEELKQQQRDEQERAAELAAEAEAKRQSLVEEESQVKEKLDLLNESVEKSIIDHEATISKQHNIKTSTGAIKKEIGPKKSALKKKKPKREEWVSETAREMEDQAIEEAIITEAEAHRSRARSVETLEMSRRQTQHRERSPFHFSPDYGVPQPQEVPVERLQDTRIEQAQVTVQQRRQQPPSRPGRAPRDSWGGFH